MSPVSRLMSILGLALGAGLLLSGSELPAQEKAKTEAKKAEKKAAPEPEIAAEQDYLKQLREAQEQATKLGTHQLAKQVKITGKNGQSLQTIAVDGKGRVLALVAPPRHFGNAQKNVSSEVHVLDADGNKLSAVTVDFHANSVNAGPDGTIYVAGDGKLARFDQDGKMVGEVVELPFIKELIKDEKGMKERAAKQIEAEKKSREVSVKAFKERLEALEKKEKVAKDKGESLSKTDAAQLEQYRLIVKSLEVSEQAQSIDAVVAGIIGRAKVISSVSANEKELFLVCGEVEGYGFSVWRMGLDLKDAKKVKSSLSGCCGQMDVQCCGEDIVVAENTRHRFARYDRDGKELATGGKRGKETEPGCFGGCCNPMNVKALGADILTAESEGIIKRFGPTGEFKSIVGGVSITGGCKNVALGASPDGSRIYFCDQPGSQVMILAESAKKSDK